jgi:ferredoxin-type protein NapH
MNRKPEPELTAIKFILGSYILLAFLFAGLNYGYAPTADPKIGHLIELTWQIYENLVKTLFIVVCSILTIRLLKRRKTGVTMQRRNFVGFFTAALVIHIVAPLATGDADFYFYAMPLPWSTMPLQLLSEASPFYHHRVAAIGAGGISIALTFFIIANVVVFTGTLLFGRRFQCSSICLFNGFAAEIFRPAFPLIGRREKKGPGLLKGLRAAKWVMVVVSLGLTAAWIFIIAFRLDHPVLKILYRIENLKYLVLELMVAMFFWVFLLGRGYCHFCPLGTVLGWLSKAAGQRIETDKSACISCRRCDSTCPMGIEISPSAAQGRPVRNGNCVGCGHCVDVCPTDALTYATDFKSKITRTKEATT